jgi:hypothetical protein
MTGFGPLFFISVIPGLIAGLARVMVRPSLQR